MNLLHRVFLILRSFVFLSVFYNTHKVVDAKEENFDLREDLGLGDMGRRTAQIVVHRLFL